MSRAVPASALFAQSLAILRKGAADVANTVQSAVQSAVDGDLGGGIGGGSGGSAAGGAGGGGGAGAGGAIVGGGREGAASAAAGDLQSPEELRSLVLRLKKALKRERDGAAALAQERGELVTFLCDAGVLQPRSAEAAESGSSSAGSPSARSPVASAGTGAGEASAAFAVGSLRRAYLVAEWATLLRRMGRDEDADRAEAAVAIAAELDSDESGGVGGGGREGGPPSIAPANLAPPRALGAVEAALAEERREKEAIMEKTQRLMASFRALQAEKRAADEALARAAAARGGGGELLQQAQAEAAEARRLLSEELGSRQAAQAATERELAARLAALRAEGGAVITGLHEELRSVRSALAEREEQLGDARAGCGRARAQGGGRHHLCRRCERGR